MGRYEIWRAHRATKSDVFGDFEREPAGDPDDVAVSVGVSADDCRLYVAKRSGVFVWSRGTP